MVSGGGNGSGIDITESSVYPNPAYDEITVRFESNAETFGRLNVTNSIGQNVFNQDINVLNGENKYLINTDRFSNGIYFIKVNVSNEIERTIRFVKTN